MADNSTSFYQGTKTRVYPVHVRVLAWYLLGYTVQILGDEKTHKYPRDIGFIAGWWQLKYLFIFTTTWGDDPI